MTNGWFFGTAARTVYVHNYVRFRFGKWEHVTDHYRSRPRY